MVLSQVEQEYRARAAQKRDELTEKLFISLFASGFKTTKPVEQIIAECRALAALIQRTHEGEI